MKPKELIIKWVKVFNNGDADLIADFYADNAVNHQVANDPVNGKIVSQRGYWDKLSFLRMHNLPIPGE
jgi:ketosteroid isomerase-like protein